MGVHGLWKLIDSAGKPIPIETLENKILAVDVSIWLYQLVKGFQERAGRTVNNPFLLGLFRRICKLLFYRIKPIFVFDGGVPALKKKTIAIRHRNRNRANEISENLRKTLLENLAKQEALGRAIGQATIQLPKMLLPKEDTMFQLPPLPDIFKKLDNDSDSSDECIRSKYETCDLQSVDITSDDFLCLPADIRHDILTELKETRKQNSWANVHLMPENSTDFSNFQMGRLLKRRAVQVGLEKAESEMGTRGFTISDIQDLLKQQGIEIDVGQRIAADNTTRFLYSSSNGEKININKKESDIPYKRPKKSRHLKKIKQMIDNDEFSSSSVDEYEIDEPAYMSILNDQLSQEEIFDMINDNKNNSTAVDTNQPSTSKYQEIIIEKFEETNDSIISEVKQNNKPKMEQNIFYEKRLPEDNNINKELVHENFSRFNDVETISSLQRNFAPHSENNGSVDENKVIHHQINTELSNEDDTNLKRNIKDIDIKVVGDSFDHNSESDDDANFLEVTTTNEDQNINIESLNIKPTLEILINTDKIKNNVKDGDLFADIFKQETNLSNDKTEQNSANQEVENGPTDEIEQIIQLNPKDVPSTSETCDYTDSTNTANHYFKRKQLNIEEIMKMKSNLEMESNILVEETSREERIAATISEQTTLEAQELLRLFGLPYIVAPMEAEAQCAYLDVTGQTQGTITDDSDIWLFGANNVYKNFFDQKKFVKQFKSSDIKRVYHLDRDDLIMVAMLTGSDYTSGLPGVGPVNALEIIAQFKPRDEAISPDQRLARFIQAYRMDRVDDKLAKKLKNLEFVEGFPSKEVVRAYTSPTIDDSREPFSWAVPNLQKLRQYTEEKFGWDIRQADQTLLPILDKFKQDKTQRTLHNYFEWAFDNIENKMSRRVEKAVNILGGKVSPRKTALHNVHQRLPSSSKSSSELTATSNKQKIITASGCLPLKSKTPAQLAREKAAKKLKEIRKREKDKKQQTSKKKS